MAAVIAVAFLKDKTVGEAMVEVVFPLLALLSLKISLQTSGCVYSVVTSKQKGDVSFELNKEE